jgi:hypothetical protein
MDVEGVEPMKITHSAGIAHRISTTCNRVAPVVVAMLVCVVPQSVLARSATCAVRVVAGADITLAGTELRCLLPDGGISYPTFGDDGVVSDLPCGPSLLQFGQSLLLASPEFSAWHEVAVSPKPGEVKSISVNWTPRRVLSVQVEDAHGIPVPATIHLVAQECGGTATHHQLGFDTTPQGIGTMLVNSTCSYEVTLMSDRKLTLLSGPAQVAPGREPVELHLVAGDHRTIVGSVVDELGHGVGEAEVYVAEGVDGQKWRSAIVRPDGQFWVHVSQFPVTIEIRDMRR